MPWKKRIGKLKSCSGKPKGVSAASTECLPNGWRNSSVRQRNVSMELSVVLASSLILWNEEMLNSGSKSCGSVRKQTQDAVNAMKNQDSRCFELARKAPSPKPAMNAANTVAVASVAP